MAHGHRRHRGCRPGRRKRSRHGRSPCTCQRPGEKIVQVGWALQATAPTEESVVTEVVCKVWGKAPAGTSITYGRGLPMTEAFKIMDNALYYHITAQLHSAGADHRCGRQLGRCQRTSASTSPRNALRAR